MKNDNSKDHRTYIVLDEDYDFTGMTMILDGLKAASRATARECIREEKEDPKPSSCTIL